MNPDFPFWLARGMVWSAMSAVILGLVGWLAPRLSRNAALRHSAWVAAFAAVGLLPVAQIALPGAHVRSSGTVVAENCPSAAPATLSPAPPNNPGICDSDCPPSASPREAGKNHSGLATNSTDDCASASALRVSIASSEGERARVRGGSDGVIRASSGSKLGPPLLASILLGVWLSGVLFMLVRFTGAWNRLLALRAASVPFDPEMHGFSPAARLAAVPANVELRIASQNDLPGPITWGWWKPVVLLPRAALNWDASRLQAVLLHEFGHVRRRDQLVQMLAMFVCTLHWFNPVFWRSARQMEAEAEMAADDCVIRGGIVPSSYAADLLQLASAVAPQSGGSVLLETCMARPCAIEDRIRSIIDPAPDRGTVGRWPLVRLQGVLLVLFLSAGMLSAALLKSPFSNAPAEPEPACIAQP